MSLYGVTVLAVSSVLQGKYIFSWIIHEHFKRRSIAKLTLCLISYLCTNKMLIIYAFSKASIFFFLFLDGGRGRGDYINKLFPKG